ncbi:MAG: RHS repeat-associated core domain-containing protein, partial [Pseudomonadota bacterium]
SERYGYDAGGRLTSITDRAGRVTRYAHFGENTPSAQKRPDGTVSHAAFSAALGLTAIEDANGARLAFARDGEDALTEIRGDGGQLLRRIERDAAGQPIRISGPLTRTEHRTDARPGCLIRKRTHRGEDAVLRSETRLFTETRTRDYADDAVRVSTRLDEAGRMAAFSFAGHEFDWAYDAAGRETALATPWGEIAYAHEPEGLVLTDPLGGRHLFGRDGLDGRPNGAVDETRHLRQGGTRLHRHLHRLGETLYAGEAIFAIGGLRRQETEAGQTRRFEYDVLDRLVAVTDRTGTQRFAYDAELNLLASPEGPLSYSAEQMLARQGARRFEHDAEGRLVQEADGTGRARRYAYDPRGFLARVEDTLSGLDIAYSYDDFGRRVAKRGADALHRKVDNSYIYAGPRLAAERDNLTGRLRHYIYRPLSQAFDSWTPVAFIDHEDETARLYTVHLGLGAFPVLVLDAKGAPVWRARYTPLGAAEEAPDTQIAFDFRLPGQVLDRETGLHHTRFRHHDPRSGRFLTVDPLFPVNAATRYAYSNAPLDRPDLLGLSRFSCSKGNRHQYSSGNPTPRAHEEAANAGIKRRIAEARERILRGEYDPLVDTIPADELDEFLETGKLSHTTDQVDWHHTTQKSSDPMMADEVDSIQPTTNAEHGVEHNGDFEATPTAGIRGDTTTPDRPIYDPNDPDVQAGAHHPDYGYDDDMLN